MRYQSFDVTAPLLLGGSFREEQVLEQACALWSRALTGVAAPCTPPCDQFAAQLLPALRRQQFLLATEAGRPVFFFTWAELSELAEARYLRNPSARPLQQDWSSGERTWVIDWLAPQGRSAVLVRLIRRRLFAGRCFRALAHRREQRGLRVLELHGITVSAADARIWFAEHPPVWAPPSRPASASFLRGPFLASDLTGLPLGTA